MRAAVRELEIDLPDGPTVVLERDGFEDRGPDNKVCRGRVRFEEQSRVTLTRTRGVVTGAIRLGDDVYELRAFPGGGHVIEKLDLSSFPAPAEPVEALDASPDSAAPDVAPDSAHSPFFSPDSESMGYLKGDSIFIASLAAGDSRKLVSGVSNAGNGAGASWAGDWIWFVDPAGALRRVAPSGGEAEIYPHLSSRRRRRQDLCDVRPLEGAPSVPSPM